MIISMIRRSHLHWSQFSLPGTRTFKYLSAEFNFRAFSVGAVDSDDLDVYLTPQRQKKNVRSLFGSVERGLNTVKQILTPKRVSANKPRKTWVSIVDSAFGRLGTQRLPLGNGECHPDQRRRLRSSLRFTWTSNQAQLATEIQRKRVCNHYLWAVRYTCHVMLEVDSSTMSTSKMIGVKWSWNSTWKWSPCKAKNWASNVNVRRVVHGTTNAVAKILLDNLLVSYRICKHRFEETCKTAWIFSHCFVW